MCDRRLVSSSYSLMKRRSLRPKTFQSRCFRSSPGVYSRCSANSTLKPWYGLLCMPETKPSTMWRALRSRRVILLRTFGSRKPGFLVAMDHPRGCAGLRRDLRQPRLLLEVRLLGGDHLEQLVDDLVRGDALRLGREVGDDAVAKHRVGDGADVRGRHEEAAFEDRVGLGADDQVLARAG